MSRVVAAVLLSLLAVRDFDGYQADIDETRPMDPNTGHPFCVDVLGWHDEHWIDPRTAKVLLRVRTFPNIPGPTVSVRTNDIVVSGAGCDRVVARTH